MTEQQQISYIEICQKTYGINAIGFFDCFLEYFQEGIENVPKNQKSLIATQIFIYKSLPESLSCLDLSDQSNCFKIVF